LAHRTDINFLSGGPVASQLFYLPDILIDSKAAVPHQAAY
jgi:hypothetical protein